MDNGYVTAAPWSVSCCPDTTQWDTDGNECRGFTTNDGCGPNFDVTHSLALQLTNRRVRDSITVSCLMEKLEASTISTISRARIACGGVETLDSMTECSEDL
jgi:hypothetical protein